MIKTHRSTCSPALAVIISALVLMFGCSTYKGQKYETIIDKKTGHVEPTGIPYTLTRPEYTLTRIPPAEGQKLPTYTLGVTYEPDPSHKYTLKIAPGIFADSNFTVKLAAGGTMQATTVTFAEQVTPTITALGTFTASLIGILAPGVLDKTSLRQTINSAIKVPDCKGEPDVPALCIENIGGPTCPLPKSVGSAMETRINAFKSDDEFVELFHYVTEKERLCLKAAAEELKRALGTTKEDQEKKKSDWETKHKEYLKKYPEDRIFVERLTLAVKNDDREEFEKIKKEIPQEKLAAERKTKKSGPLSDKNDLIVSAQMAAKSRTEIEAQVKLDFFLKMDAPTWSGRNLLYLEREIEKMEIFALRHPGLTPSQKAQIEGFISNLRRQRAATIGALELYDRSVTLSKFLESIKEKSVKGGRAPATSEYATVRAELDAALAQIEARRARILANAKPAPPPQAPPLNVTNLKRVLPQAIVASRVPGWIDTDEGEKADDYVLVLKGVE